MGGIAFILGSGIIDAYRRCGWRQMLAGTSPICMCTCSP